MLAVPEQPDDDGLVPPIKVMRKRLNGVYSAEGFAGPTRRYVLIVAMLVGLASLPTLAAITAGSHELDDGRTGALDVPFIPPAATGPVRLPPAPTASAGPGDPHPDGTAPGSPGTVRGQAQKRKTRPRPAAPVQDGKGYAPSTGGGSSGSSASSGSARPAGPSRPSGDGPESWQPGWQSGRPGWPSGGGSGAAGWVPDSSGSGSGSGSSGTGSSQGGPVPVPPPSRPTVPVFPSVPNKPQQPSDSVGSGDGDARDDGWDGARDGDHSSGGGDRSGGDWAGGDWAGGGSPDGRSPGRDGDDDADSRDDQRDPPARPVRPPWCTDRGDCSSRPSHHHRPDRPRRHDCDDRGRGHRPPRQPAGNRAITVHIEAGGHLEAAGPAKARRAAGRDHHHPSKDSPAGRDRPERALPTISIRTAKAARSDSRRRSEVTERPQNVRPTRSADRTHNSNRYQPPAADRGDGTQTTTATRAYRGSHRAERMHRVNDHTGAHHRSSRMGRHHTEQVQDPQDHQQNRW